MQNIWIITANTSKANIYELTKNNELSILEELEHEEATLKIRDLVTDRPGRFVQGGATHGQRTSAEPKKIEDKRFAKNIVNLLENGRNKQAFNKLIIIAPPHFLGAIKNNMNKHLLNLAVLFIPKDFTKVTKEEILNILQVEHKRELSTLV